MPDFPILDRLTFLNHAGVSPVSGAAADALRIYADQAASAAYVDAGWYHRAGEVRDKAAQLIGASSGREIAYIPNTTHGIALVAAGMRWREGDEVVISSVEYPANRYPWEDLKRFGVKLREVDPQPDGRIDVDDVLDAITNCTRVVALSHVQYSSGFRIDLKPISDMVHDARGYLVVDAIQSVGVLPVDVHAMGIDFLSADGHKWMMSPEGCGIFYAREDLVEDLHPMVAGWMCMVDAINYGDYRFEFLRDARRFEPGTWNVPGILALGASIEMLLGVGIGEVWSRVDALTQRLRDGLASKGYRVISPGGADERSGIVVFDVPGDRDVPGPAAIVKSLEEQGIVIVVREGRLRASPHFYNTAAQIDRLIDALP